MHTWFGHLVKGVIEYPSEIGWKVCTSQQLTGFNKLLESLYTYINFPTVSLKQVNCCDGMIISAASSEELQIFSSVEELQGSALISTFLDLMIKETVMLVMFES